MKKSLLHLFLYSWLILPSYGQGRLDSIISILKTDTLSEEKQTSMMIDLAKEFNNSNTDSGLFYANKAYMVASEQGFEKLRSRAKGASAQALYRKGAFLKSRKEYQESYAILEQIGDTNGMASNIYSIGTTYSALGEYDSALSYYEKSLSMMTEEVDPLDKANLFNNIGIIHIRKMRYDQAEEGLKESIELYKLSEQPSEQTGPLNNLAILRVRQGKYIEAIELYHKCLDIHEEANDEYSLAYTYLNLANLYYVIDEKKSFFDYANQSLDIRKELGDSSGMLRCYTNISSVHYELHEYEKALESAGAGLPLAEKLGQKSSLAHMLRIIGSIYVDRDRDKEAKEMLDRSMRITEEMNINRDKGLSHKALGYYYENTDNESKAIYHYQKALDLMQGSNFSTIKDISERLYKIYRSKGQSSLALKNYEIYVNAKDRVSNDSNDREIIKREYKYEYEKQAAIDSISYIEEQRVAESIIAQQEAEVEKKNATIKAQRITQIALIGGLLLLIIFGFILYKRYKYTQEQNRIIEKQKEELLNTQEQLIQAEKMASLGRLTAGVAHEINNPINFMTSGVEGLRLNIDDLNELIDRYDEYLTSKESNAEIKSIQDYKEEIGFEELREGNREILTSIEEGSNRVTEIIKNLEAYNVQAYSNVGKSFDDEIDIHEVIDESLEALSEDQLKKIEIKKYYDEKIKGLKANQGELKQVFISILENAVQAIEKKGKPEGKIIISSQLNDQIEINIEDNGCGMSKEVMSHIFDPFFTTKEIGKGQGLGLSTAIGIVQGHNGSIKVQSDEGAGSIFTIQLPGGSGV